MCFWFLFAYPLSWILGKIGFTAAGVLFGKLAFSKVYVLGLTIFRRLHCGLVASLDRKRCGGKLVCIFAMVGDLAGLRSENGIYAG